MSVFREFEDLDLYKQIVLLADKVWDEVHGWADNFAKETIGVKLAQSVDEIGSYLVEGDGRQSLKEKLTYTYYARGSLKGARYWWRRAIERKLVDSVTGSGILKDFESIHKQLNTLITNKKKLIEGGPGVPTAPVM